MLCCRSSAVHPGYRALYSFHTCRLTSLFCLQACDGADAAIVVIGSSMIDNDKDAATGSYRPATEGEGLDRINLALPGRQGDLVKALATRAQGLPLVVVVMHGGGLDIGWMKDMSAVNALLAVGFPGQVGLLQQMKGCSLGDSEAHLIRQHRSLICVVVDAACHVICCSCPSCKNNQLHTTTCCFMLTHLITQCNQMILS